jgi:hypothetical protein
VGHEKLIPTQAELDESVSALPEIPDKKVAPFLSLISKDQQKKLLLLYHGNIEKPSKDIERLVELLQLDYHHRFPTLPLLVERLLQVYYNIGFHVSILFHDI